MINVSNLSKSYGKDTVLKQLSLSLPAGQTLSILGKSGCGKTTLLKVMAGLEKSDGGSFAIHGQDMLALPPQARNIVYLSQEPLLFPHLTVAQNIGFGLRIRKTPPEAVAKQTQEMLEKLGLQDHGHKMPEQLSGGQRQRAAFGRALVVKPRLLLLDEPFGSLDTHTRREMQVLFREISLELQMTALFVTHDLREAIVMGDLVALMDKSGLRIFPDKRSLLQVAETGLQEELNFWQGMMKEMM